MPSTGQRFLQRRGTRLALALLLLIALAALGAGLLARDAPAEQFRDAFVTRYGQPPTMLAAYAFDAISMVQSRVEAGTTTRDEMAAALAGLRDSRTAGSSNGFTSARTPQSPTHVLRLEGTTWVSLTP